MVSHSKLTRGFNIPNLQKRVFEVEIYNSQQEQRNNSARSNSKPTYSKKPSWLKTKIPSGSNYSSVRKKLRQGCLHSVCEEAKCPNIYECWNNETATFMVLGDTCTRNCLFCNVKTAKLDGMVDPLEPSHLASTIEAMKLKYVVITMVTRDDLPDGGASHIAEIFKAIREKSPETMIEFLSSDLGGDLSALRTVLHEKPAVFAHNIETTRGLTSAIRDSRADYEKSLEVLSLAKKEADYPIFTKSGLMLGLGESFEDVVEALKDLRQHDVDFLTIGQYLRPGEKNAEVKEHVHPDVFAELAVKAKELGFLSVASAPLVRSSYKACEFYEEASKSLK